MSVINWPFPRSSAALLAATRMDRPWLAILVYGDVGQGRFGHLNRDFLWSAPLSEHLHVDRHGGAPHFHDLGIEAHEIADQNRLLEQERVHRHRRHTPFGK